MAKPVSIFVVNVVFVAASAAAADKDEENSGVVPVFKPRCVLRLSWRYEFRNEAIETIKAIIKADSMGDDDSNSRKKPTSIYEAAHNNAIFDVRWAGRLSISELEI